MRRPGDLARSSDSGHWKSGRPHGSRWWELREPDLAAERTAWFAFARCPLIAAQQW